MRPFWQITTDFHLRCPHSSPPPPPPPPPPHPSLPPPHNHLCHIFPTCDFDLRWNGLSGAGEVPSAASVPPGVTLLDPGDHQVPLPHDLELVGRGQVQELAILDPPGDIIS